MTRPVRSVVAVAVLGTSLMVLSAGACGHTAPTAAERPDTGRAPSQASPASPQSQRDPRPDVTAIVELQQQMNELRSDLLDEREKRIGRWQETNGTVLVVLVIVIGIGGLWAYAKFRVIAAQAELGMAVARGHAYAPWGGLSQPGPAPALPDPDKAAAAARLNLVHVREAAQPEGAERLEWFLLTTLAVQSRQDAERVLEWYRLRWRIEDWHRVLKTGCKVEYLAHRTGERIERAVTINAVIAWRLMAMTLLGRDTPELPAETLFSDIEIAALEDFAQDRKLSPPDNIGRAVLTTAMLGGYLGFKRKRYAGPGHQVLWEGYTRLATIVQACERSLRLDQDSKLHLRLRKNKTYG